MIVYALLYHILPAVLCCVAGHGPLPLVLPAVLIQTGYCQQQQAWHVICVLIGMLESTYSGNVC